ncbi:hypothetical protein K9M06_02345 [Candidatus Bipolaricaulota bacterium]|nr:hypothetical protein [Candidatus Bipolaricaulota bacterium]
MVLPTDRSWRRNRKPSPFSSGDILDEMFQNLKEETMEVKNPGHMPGHIKKAM